MDNTFGIDWFGIDWSSRPLNSWHDINRPLINRLLSYPYYKDLFNQYLNELILNLLNSNWYSELQQKKNQLSASVQFDSYYTMDYGFQYADFLNAIDTPYGFHVTQSIAEYLQNRLNIGLNQIEIIGNQNQPCTNKLEYLSNELIDDSTYYNLLGQEINIDAISNQIVIQKFNNGKLCKVFIP